jgi:hypothetical protein
MPVKAFFFFAALFFCTKLYPQMTLDVHPQPEPLAFVIEAMSPAFKVPVKKVAWIKQNDTLDVYHLDKKGNEVLRYNYYNNKRGSKTVTTYTNDLKAQTRYTTKNDEVVTTYKYNAAGKTTEWGKVTTYFNATQKSMGDFKWLFEFDAKGNIIKKYREDAAKVKALNAEYTYDATNKVQQAVINGQWVSVFTYTDTGLLKSREESLNGQVASSFQYGYDETGNLITESNKYYTVAYMYDGAVLKNCVYTYLKDNTTEDITFFYEDGRLSKAVVKRNGLTTFSPFNFDRDYRRGTDFVLTFEFVYDSHKNVSEIKYYMNEVYRYSSQYVYEYY